MCIGQSIYTISNSGGPSPTGGVPFPTVEEHLPQAEFYFRQWSNISCRRSSFSDSRGISPTGRGLSDSGGTSPAGGLLFPRVEEHLLQAEFYFRQWSNIACRRSSFSDSGGTTSTGRGLSDSGGTSPVGRVLFLTAVEHLL